MRCSKISAIGVDPEGDVATQNVTHDKAFRLSVDSSVDNSFPELLKYRRKLFLAFDLEIGQFHILLSLDTDVATARGNRA